VLTALNGPDGLRALQAYPVDVLLLDYSMPEMNAEEVALEVRHMYPKLPIVLISASAVDDDWSVLERVDAYIRKKNCQNGLLGTLQGLLLDPVRAKRIDRLMGSAWVLPNGPDSAPNTRRSKEDTNYVRMIDQELVAISDPNFPSSPYGLTSRIALRTRATAPPWSCRRDEQMRWR